MIRRWLRRFAPRDARVPPEGARLNEASATAIARAAVPDGWSAQHLHLFAVETVEGRTAWHYVTATKGSGWSVDVDDATGEATPRRWGVR